MAFDIYVGPASRYQKGDWKNIVQQAAEVQGINYIKVGPKEGLLSRLFKPKPQNVYETWRAQIRAAASASGFPEPVWDDSPQQEYVTDRPGWEGFVAFVAQYAYARNPDLTPPAKALLMPDLDDDPAFNAEMQKEGSPVSVIMGSQFFLPTAFSFAFSVTNFSGHPTGATSVDELDFAINKICTHCGYDRTQLSKGEFDQVGEDATFAQAALYGTSIFARLVGEALVRNLPLILDY